MNKLLATSACAALVVGAVMTNSPFALADTPTTTQERSVSSFDQVKLRGSMDVEIKVGPARSVTVIADSDIIDRIETEVEGDELVIGLERGHSYRNIRKMLVKVTVPDLTDVDLTGSGDMEITGLERKDFGMSLRGSGDITLKSADVDDLDINLKGSGDIVASGSCDTVTVNLAGSGDIDARDMRCKSADVTLKGSGDVTVYASDMADVLLQGSGDVSVHGDPDKVSSKVRGSGDVEVR
ncbi:DUF2807 domain-containing protein [Kordiimonas sediminis]|uniref:DUF2807 domain-containing protein n=1 Tax=Kordiimonas sediminis TaxID=1735581 RepID=A0A919AJD2_9PROT|nr:head GIN domain-containing protein [Kordiimonas sediminis]GHF10757.1 DUF2807 domain-containing protein [Kordiimonas sediminis]